MNESPLARASRLLSEKQDAKWRGANPEYIKHLEDTGALAKIEAYYDAIEAGDDPIGSTGISVDEVIKKVREIVGLETKTEKENL